MVSSSVKTMRELNLNKLRKNEGVERNCANSKKYGGGGREN